LPRRPRDVEDFFSDTEIILETQVLPMDVDDYFSDTITVLETQVIPVDVDDFFSDAITVLEEQEHIPVDVDDYFGYTITVLEQLNPTVRTVMDIAIRGQPHDLEGNPLEPTITVTLALAYENPLESGVMIGLVGKNVLLYEKAPDNDNFVLLKTQQTGGDQYYAFSEFVLPNLLVGTYSFYGLFAGDETYKPSQSDTLSTVIEESAIDGGGGAGLGLLLLAFLGLLAYRRKK